MNVQAAKFTPEKPATSSVKLTSAPPARPEKSEKVVGKNGGARPGAGRPVDSILKRKRELQQKVAEIAPDLAQTVMSIANDTELPASQRLQACEMLLNRAFGRPSATAAVEQPSNTGALQKELAEALKG